jgi:lipoate-protein ligase A
MWMDNWVLNQPFFSWPRSPDESVRSHQRVLYRFFEARRPAIVLSSSNQPSIETFEDTCAQLQIPILQRRGGGGTVLLGPGCLILTFAFYAKDVFSNQRYFALINDLWAQSLSHVGLHGLTTRGHSDLAKGERKIAGTSLFRRKHLVVYQGSLLVSPDFQLIERVLRHPSREPDYRDGRSHRDFLVSAHELGYLGTTAALAAHCSSFFREHVHAHLQADFADEAVLPGHQTSGH